MAVMRHSIIFGGVDSADYGIYIGGEGVFNAPQRDVEMIEIPGRNGAFALDRGRFKNIEVTYTAINHEPDLATFSANLEAFRNALASQKGYQRLTDTFHPDEYRMAAFVNGLEIEPIEYNTAAEFEVTFDCKPQRFLTSGETAVTVSSGDAITNPTLFKASPLLEVEGYGTINVNGTEIEIDDVLVGDVVAVYGYSKHDLEGKIDFSNVYIAPNNLIEVNGVTTRRVFVKQSGTPSISSANVLGWTGDATVSPSVQVGTYPTVFIEFSSPLSFYYGTSARKRVNATVEFTFTDSSTVTMQLISEVIYNGDREITISSSYYPIISGEVRYGLYSASVDAESVVVHSTATAFGHPTYIDCDLGEAYAIDDGVISSLNSYIMLGSVLPSLTVGESEITFDNTIESLKITPRWWRI